MTRLIGMLLLAFAGSGCETRVFNRPPTPASRLTHEELLAEPVPPGERYYLLLFSSQSMPKRLIYTHSWCTAVRVAADGAVAEQFSISWMPRTLEIVALRYTVEPGVNLDLAGSLAMAERKEERVTLFGPYEIRATLFRRLKVQAEFLASGAIGYQGLDVVGEARRRGNGSNCIHAITDADPKFGRAGYLLVGGGDQATRYIRNMMAHRGALVDPETTHDWLLPSLGLDPARLRRGWPGVWALSRWPGLIR